ncbi:MAG TPA: hypothetical protein VKZ78_00790 [Sphingobacteriaceae bacterium]|nr:hypothetical protein [Sphingobacteriaceae bacterium]
MNRIVVWTLMGFLFAPLWGFAQTADSPANPVSSSENGSVTGYVVLAALVLAVIIYVLFRKQYRKFNE